MTEIGNILVGPVSGSHAVVQNPGSVVDRILGSGLSFPAFPGVVEYNGLIMNDITTYDYFHIESVDGIDDAEVRDYNASNPNLDGEISYGSQYGGRSLVINGEIRAYDLWKTDDMRAQLQAAFKRSNTEIPLRLHMPGAINDRLIYCRRNAKIEMPWKAPSGQQSRVPFMVPLRASDPRMVSIIPETYERNSIGLFRLRNEGNYEARTLVRFFGPMTSATLTRTHNGEVQTIVVSDVADGDFVQVEGTRVTNIAGTSAYSHYDDNSDWMFIGAGPVPNDFQFSGSGFGTNTKLYIQYRHSWVGA